MQHQLTEEQRLIVDTVKRITREKIAPLVEELDRRAELPWEVHKILLDLSSWSNV